MTVGRLLKDQGFSLQSSVKALEGNQHPDRDAQFRYLNAQVRAHQAAGDPVISVDAKKKEKIGQYNLGSAELRWFRDTPGVDPQVKGLRLARKQKTA